MQLYNSIKVENLVSRCLNHKPFLVSCTNQAYGRDRRRKLFRFEASWNMEEDFGARIKNFWKNSGGHNNIVSRVQHLLEECQKTL